MNLTGVPIKVMKRDTLLPGDVSAENSKSHSCGSTLGKASAASEPHVQLLEVSPGVYDIVVTCRCGEKTTIRCNSLEIPTAEITPSPAQTAQQPSVPSSPEESAA